MSSIGRVAAKPTVEVSGRTILAGLLALGKYKDRVIRLMLRNGITDLHPDRWYPRTKLVDSLFEIREVIGGGTLLLMGKKLYSSLPGADEPLSAAEMEDMLQNLDNLYQLLHRYTGQFSSSDPIGNLYYEKVGEQSARMVCDTPYPPELIQGFVLQACRRVDPMVQVVVEQFLQPTCHLRVHWEDIVH